MLFRSVVTVDESFVAGGFVARLTVGFPFARPPTGFVAANPLISVHTPPTMTTTRTAASACAARVGFGKNFTHVSSRVTIQFTRINQHQFADEKQKTATDPKDRWRFPME